MATPGPSIDAGRSRVVHLDLAGANSVDNRLKRTLGGASRGRRVDANL
jgi:hypothetical protein